MCIACLVASGFWTLEPRIASHQQPKAYPHVSITLGTLGCVFDICFWLFATFLSPVVIPLLLQQKAVTSLAFRYTKSRIRLLLISPIMTRYSAPETWFDFSPPTRVPESSQTPVETEVMVLLLPAVHCAVAAATVPSSGFQCWRPRISLPSGCATSLGAGTAPTQVHVSFEHWRKIMEGWRF
jgi:hypothetical protein